MATTTNNMASSPFKITYPINGPAEGAKNYSPYSIFCYMNLVKWYIAGINKMCIPIYVYETVDGVTSIFIAVKNIDGYFIDCSSYQSVFDSFIGKRECVVYDPKLDGKPGEVQYANLEYDPNFSESLTAMTIKAKAAFTSSTALGLYVGNNLAVKYNLSRILPDPMFCDGYLMFPKKYSSDDIEFGLSLPLDYSVTEILKSDPNEKRSFTILDQFRMFSEIISEPSEINRKLVKRPLSMDEWYLYGEKKDQIYETQLLKMKKFLAVDGLYVGKDPLVLLLGKNIFMVENIFYSTDYIDDLDNKLRLLQKNYFWYEICSPIDITLDLLQEIAETTTGMTIHVVSNNFAILKGTQGQKFIEDAVIQIKMGKLPTGLTVDSNIRIPVMITDDGITVHGKILEAPDITTEEEFNSVVNDWAKYYYSKTGKMTVFYF